MKSQFAQVEQLRIDAAGTSVGVAADLRGDFFGGASGAVLAQRVRLLSDRRCAASDLSSSLSANATSAAEQIIGRSRSMAFARIDHSAAGFDRGLTGQRDFTPHTRSA